MLHGQTPFTVTLEGFDDMVFLMVMDGCSSPPFLVAARPMAAGGRGLAIIDAVSSDWGAHQAVGGGKCVWAAFDRHVNDGAHRSSPGRLTDPTLGGGDR